MHPLSINKIACLITWMFALFISSIAAAQEDKAGLVDQIIKSSSIKIAIQGIPQQLAQLPQMLPISANDQAAFTKGFLTELSSNYNEADALKSIRHYFIENGDSNRLVEIQNWLISPVGKRVTQAELLSQQQVDAKKLRRFMQRYRPNKEDKRHQQYTRLVNALDLGDKIFALVESLAPKILDTFTPESPDSREQANKPLEATSVSFQKQLSEMKKKFDAAIGPQMITAMAFQFKDLSDEELEAYTNFTETEAGRHFNDLILRSSTHYSTEWVLNILPHLIGGFETTVK